MPRFKVFTSKKDLGNSEVSVEQSYPAFQVVSATVEAAEVLRQSYPVQRLPDPPSTETPTAFAAMASANDDRRGRRDWTISYLYPIKREWVRELSDLGATVLGSAGNSAVIAAVPNLEVLADIERLDHVQSVELHRVAIDIDPSFLDGVGAASGAAEDLSDAVATRDAAVDPTRNDRRDFAIPGALYLDFYDQNDAQAAFRRLHRYKIHGVAEAGPTRLSIDLSHSKDIQEDLLTLFKCPGLRKIEQKKVKQLFNDKAREVIGANVVSGNPASLLTGTGEIVAVADSGLDTGDAQTVHADFRGRVVNIESWPIAPSLAPFVTNPGGDDGASDDFSGHGTHVAGSVLGNGSRAQTLGITPVEGMAPEAQLVFQAIEQRPNWTNEAILFFLGQGQTPPASGLFGIPDDLTQLFDSAYQKGARIHNNSWGGGTPGAYDAQCTDVDRFVWEHKDMLIVVAAGNSGTDQIAPTGSVDPISVDSPGTAKNCLTVGACENDRAGQFSDQYGQWWPSDFPNASLKTDPMVDSVDDIVAFSSRGPCTTGRRKPDVIAPGTFILSTRSSRMPPNNFSWGAFNPAKSDYMFMGGTSMASPLVAGSAALLRQYLRVDHNIASPSAALLKAGLIHSAQYLDYRFKDPNSVPFVDNEQGWGRVTLEDVIRSNGSGGPFFHDDTQGLFTGEARGFRLSLSQPGPIRMTMCYSDAPGEDLVNNLNLLAFGPSGSAIIGNDFTNAGLLDDLNNVEAVFVDAGEVGDWTIQIVASEVVLGPQDFALVISGPAGSVLQPL